MVTAPACCLTSRLHCTAPSLHCVLRVCRLLNSVLDKKSGCECKFKSQGRVAFHLFNLYSSPCYLWEFGCSGDEARVVTSKLLADERKPLLRTRRREGSRLANSFMRPLFYKAYSLQAGDGFDLLGHIYIYIYVCNVIVPSPCPYIYNII